MILRFLKACCLVASLSAPLTLSAQSFPSSFDDILKESAGRYLPAYDWRWWKAQCYQESKLDPLAVSPKGAMSLSQIMPDTWAEQAGMMGINASPFNPRANALVGAAYMRRMLRVWKADRSALDRLRWAQGSYNCGVGCVLRAQKRAEGETVWVLVSPFVPRETRAYVLKIGHWYGEMAE